MNARYFDTKEYADWFVEGLEAAQVEWVQITNMNMYPPRYLVEWKI